MHLYIYFGPYIKPYIKKIDHTALIQEWKINLYTAAYLKNIYKKDRFPSNKKEIDQHDSQ